MKTPKRIIPCPQCGAPLEIGTTVIKSWDECYEVPALFCSRTGEEISLPFKSAKEFSARWKRKNREARLRHRISRLEQHILWQRQKARDIKRYWLNNMVPFIDCIDTYGQDVEGC